MTTLTHMNDLFNYKGHRIRTAGTSEKPLFEAKDVCKVLGYNHTPQAYRMLDADERGVHIVDTPGGPQEMTCIIEEEN